MFLLCQKLKPDYFLRYQINFQGTGFLTSGG